MNLSEEIKKIVRDEVISNNRLVSRFFILLLFVSMCLSITVIVFKGSIFSYVISFIMFLNSFMFYMNKIRLDEDSLNKWFMSSPNTSTVVKKADKLVKETWEKEKDKEIVYLTEYHIKNKEGERIISFVHDGKEITFSLDDVRYDEGEKRIEFYLSDRDWTVNIQKGTWVNVQIYNV